MLLITAVTVFSLVETIRLKTGRDHCPGVQNVHFRLPSLAQKRCMFKLPNVFMAKENRGTEFSMLDRTKTG